MIHELDDYADDCSFDFNLLRVLRIDPAFTIPEDDTGDGAGGVPHRSGIYEYATFAGEGYGCALEEYALYRVLEDWVDGYGNGYGNVNRKPDGNGVGNGKARKTVYIEAQKYAEWLS